MPSSFVKIHGKRWSLAEVSSLTKLQRRALFQTPASRKKLTVSFVARKLAGMVKGVEHNRVAYFRIPYADFPAVKKREMRFLLGKTSSKRSPKKWSPMLRRKMATHLLLVGNRGVRWDRVSAYRPSHQLCQLSDDCVCSLLRPFSRLVI